MKLQTLEVLLYALVAAWTWAPNGQAAPLACGDTGDVAVQVLGSGGPIADDGRASSSYLVWLEGDSRVLIDFGGGAFLRFGEAGGTFDELDFVGISHFHTDHSADLPALLKSGYFSRRTRPLEIAGPGPGGPFPGLNEFLVGFLGDDHGAYRYLAGYLDGTDGMVKLLPTEISETASGSKTVKGLSKRRFEVDVLGVPHGIVPTLAFRIRAAGRSLVFGSDQTGKNPEFIDFARNADLLVMHMAIPGNAGSAALSLHATPSAIAEIASQSAAKKLVLSHFMARSLNTLEENVATVEAIYDGPIVVADDLACIEIDAESHRNGVER